MCVSVCVYMPVCVFLCLIFCVCVCLYVCVFVSVFLSVYVHLSVWLCVSVCLCVSRPGVRLSYAEAPVHVWEHQQPPGARRPHPEHLVAATGDGAKGAV